MIPAFNKLSSSEIELMYKAPVLTCILIAGADGEIDRREMRSAIEFATKKQKKEQSGLVELYREVGEDFEDKLKIVLQSYPSRAAERNPLVAGELAQLNAILPKLERNFARAFYLSIKEIAVGIANSSGGLLGLNKVGEEEAKYLGLPMIKEPA